MKYVSIDLELNQPSNKIIQIGAVTYDTDKGIINTLRLMVDPGETINWDTQLKNQSITLAELLPFSRNEHESLKKPTKVALDIFWSWLKQQQSSKKIVQWGNSDIKHVRNESQEHKVRYPRNLHILNVKLIYSMLYRSTFKLPSTIGSLKKVCEYMNLPMLTAHDALNDAIMCGNVYYKIFKAMQLAYLVDKSVKENTITL